LAVNQFIGFFPGEDTKERVFNFVKLFGLEKVGCWHPSDKKWVNVGYIGAASLSRINGDDAIWGAAWEGDNACIFRDSQRIPSLFVTSEDILPAA
jgi:hypothetical protein